jgi:DNA-binding transcriptional MerR regulator
VRAAAAPDGPAGTPDRDRPAPALMSIGEVLAELRAEFPDTTISKLRFLEAEGLVEPRRTPAGYRKYSWDDVARLRYVLTAQRDQYLPLRVIREQLLDGGGRMRPRPALVAVHEPDAGAGTEVADVRLRRADLIARAGIDDALLDGMQEHGLVAPRAGGWYDADALAVAEAMRELACYGIEPRHLRPYRAAADRAAGLFRQLVSPLLRQADPAARARAAETMRELTGLSLRLHAALIRAGLRDTVGR